MALLSPGMGTCLGGAVGRGGTAARLHFPAAPSSYCGCWTQSCCSGILAHPPYTNCWGWDLHRQQVQLNGWDGAAGQQEKVFESGMGRQAQGDPGLLRQ